MLCRAARLAVARTARTVHSSATAAPASAAVATASAASSRGPLRVAIAAGAAALAGVAYAVASSEASMQSQQESQVKLAPVMLPSKDGFPHWEAKNHSLVKKHLSRELYAALRHLMTPRGFTLDDAIQSAVDNQDSGVGIYAGDEESFSVFAPLMDKIIEEYHNHGPTAKHVSDMDASKLHGNPDPEGKYVVSTRIRVGRNIRGLGLPPGTTRQERRETERLVTSSLLRLEGDLSGRYFSLSGMSEADRQQLVKDHFLFKKGDRFLQSAGANRDWPESRGIFHNNEKTFLVWVNEEDQMRIISMQKGGDFRAVFSRLARAVGEVEKQIKSQGYEFMYNDHLGYIHSCPSNLGTGMRASVHVKLPLLSEHPKFEEVLTALRLQARGMDGEHSKSVGGVYDISNKERLGKSEVQLVQTMIDGVSKLIELEKKLERKEAI